MRIAITGHRPPKIGGYNPTNPLRLAVRLALHAELEALDHCYDEVDAISGMALGVDQDFASLCLELRIPFTAAVPFLGQESRWPIESQAQWRLLLAQARTVVYVSPPGYSAAKMQIRNEYMVDWAAASEGVLIAVWDGSPGGTANCVAYAEAHHPSLDILRINPQALLP